RNARHSSFSLFAPVPAENAPGVAGAGAGRGPASGSAPRMNTPRYLLQRSVAKVCWESCRCTAGQRLEQSGW
ncbi:hypothetical protein SMA90_34315, partial [Escherichia coli]